MINYADKDEWGKFIEEYIIPLRDSAKILINYWEYLKRNIEGVDVDDMGEGFKMLVLGGVGEDGNYSERSLALFYKKFFGVQLTNLEECVKGLPAKAIVEKSDFVKFAEKIHEQTKKIISTFHNILGMDLERLEGKIEMNFEEVVRNAERVAELIKEFYERTLKVTANYNQYTLFLFTVRKITRRYLEIAYPEMKEKGKFDALKGIIGLEKYFEPKVEGERTEGTERIERDYTIWHLPGGSFGFEICHLNDIIWECFSREDFRKTLEFLFENVQDLKEEFVRRAKEALDELDWKFPEYILNKSNISDVGYAISIKYKTSGLKLREFIYCKRVEYNGYGWKYWTTDKSMEHELDIRLPKLLDDISPALFVGIADIVVYSDELSIDWKVRYYFCLVCKYTSSKPSKTCPKCGTEMFCPCPKCEYALRGHEYCPICGAKIY